MNKLKSSLTCSNCSKIYCETHRQGMFEWKIKLKNLNILIFEFLAESLDKTQTKSSFLGIKIVFLIFQHYIL